MSFGKYISSRKNFHLRGTNELKVALNEKADLDLVRKILALNGSELQRNAQRKAPVDTGNLERSITLSSDLASRGLEVRVKAYANYAGYVEWGTRFMYAQPYMRPAYREQKRKFKQDMDRIMK